MNSIYMFVLAMAGMGLCGIVIHYVEKLFTKKKPLHVWLDDLRPMPSSFNIHVLTAKTAIQCLQTGRVSHISLDHDLGDDPAVGSGNEVAVFIEEGAFDGTLPRLVWTIHSANPVGINKMTQALRNADKFWDNSDAIKETK